MEVLRKTLHFEVVDLYMEEKKPDEILTQKAGVNKKYNIAVAGAGYVGLSIAPLLSQHNHVTAADIIPEKVEMINQKKSPIQDDYIQKYLALRVSYFNELDNLCRIQRTEYPGNH